MFSGSISTVILRRTSGISASIALSALRMSARLAALQKELHPVFTPRRTSGAGAGPRMTKLPEAVKGFSRCTTSCRSLHRILERSPAHDDVHESQQWWIAHATAERQLALEERREVLPAGELDAVVLGIERLHDGFSNPLPAPRATRNLGEQLEGPLARPEIGDAETNVGGDHAYERHAREVVALGDHLRPDEYVQVAGGEARQERSQRPFPSNRISIDPADARTRETAHADAARPSPFRIRPARGTAPHISGRSSAPSSSSCSNGTAPSSLVAPCARSMRSCSSGIRTRRRIAGRTRRWRSRGD